MRNLSNLRRYMVLISLTFIAITFLYLFSDTIITGHTTYSKNDSESQENDPFIVFYRINSTTDTESCSFFKNMGLSVSIRKIKKENFLFEDSLHPGEYEISFYCDGEEPFTIKIGKSRFTPPQPSETAIINVNVTDTGQVIVKPVFADDSFCNNNICNKYENCLSCPEDCGTCPPSRTDPKKTNPSKTTAIKEENITHLDKTHSASWNIKKGEPRSFKVKEEIHDVYLRNINRKENKATFDVYSKKKTVDIETGKNRKIDLDNDGVYDITLLLKSISDKKFEADIELKGITRHNGEYLENFELKVPKIKGIIFPGKEKSLVLSVKNKGAMALNKCQLKSDKPKRLESTQMTNIANGEIIDFMFILKIEDEIPNIWVECLEGRWNVTTDFVIYRPEINIKFLDINQGIKNITLTYKITSDSSFQDKVLFRLTDNQRTTLAEKEEEIDCGSSCRKNITISIDKEIKGLVNLAAVHDDNVLIEDTIIYDSSLVKSTGFISKDLFEGSTLSIGTMLIAFIILAITITLRIRKNVKDKIKEPLKKDKEHKIHRKTWDEESKKEDDLDSQEY